MMIARFRSVGWVAGCAAAALCCYLASQRVASERLALAKVDRDIVDTRADNARLATEIATRSRLGQIERWNVSFRLGAASPRQYLASTVQLAAYVGGKPLPLDPAIAASRGAVATVAYAPTAPTPMPAIAPARPLQTVSVTATSPAPTSSAPLLRQATFVRPKQDRLSGDGDGHVVKVALAKIADIPAPHLDGILDDPAPRSKPTKKLAQSLLPTDLGALVAAEDKARHGKADR